MRVYNILIHMIIGIDEVGRGAWAGPLVVAAVQLPNPLPAELDILTDSKKLTPAKRANISYAIQNIATFVGLGWVSASEVDDLGLTAAMKLACKRALKGAPETDIVIDGHIDFVANGRSRCEIKADDSVPAVSAASIVAKVARDNYMAVQAKQFPLHGFDKHVGYGTALHRAALAEHGLTPIHRHSYKPIRQLLDLYEA